MGEPKPALPEIRPPAPVPLNIRRATMDALGEVPADHKIAVVAQAFRQDGQTLIRGAVYYKIAEDFTFVGYVEHDLRPKGLTVGAELRWSR